jgi:four helix bundle protein
VFGLKSILKLKTDTLNFFMPYSSFENLDVWKRACRLSVRVYEILKDCRDYSLKDQMCRAAVSIASNIAEGAERDSRKEFIRFLHIAKGSAAELRTQVYIATKIGLIGSELQRELVEELITLSKMLHQLAASLKNNIGS